MITIENHLPQTQNQSEKSVIIDVREPAEYQEHHIPGTINIPATQYHRELFLAFEKQSISLICESGSRATQIAAKLHRDGFERVSICEKQMADIPMETSPGGWTIDRQFRMTLGLLLATFLLLEFMGINQGIIIPMILGTGLVITSIIDRCYMRIGIARLPWNRGRVETF